MRAASNSFDAKLGLRLAKDRNGVPSQVQYHRPCLGLCRMAPGAQPRLARELCMDVESTFARMVEAHAVNND
eukprot:14464717-Alexandrium_andersonii.AAC.1